MRWIVEVVEVVDRQGNGFHERFLEGDGDNRDDVHEHSEMHCSKTASLAPLSNVVSLPSAVRRGLLVTLALEGVQVERTGLDFARPR